ncbi:MAG: sigma-70 family RNA polymerase sigma factor [Pygmaiobacter massiliensis]
MTMTSCAEVLPEPQVASAQEESYTAAQIDAMTTEELLAAYKRTGLQELKWPLVLRYEGLVKSIALQIRGVYSSFAQVDDIISEGVLTLLSSVDKFDPEKGVKFETYVAKRIRGMIIDLARRQDWLPRSVRKRAKEVDQTVGELYTRLGRFPTDQEIADELGTTVAKYQKDMANMALSNVLSLEALFEEKEQGSATERISSTDPSSMPEHALQEAELQKVLADGIASLRENEQMVLALYYQKNLNMKKIAQVMEVSEPRISQLHTRAVQKLRVYLEQYMKNEG